MCVPENPQERHLAAARERRNAIAVARIEASFEALQRAVDAMGPKNNHCVGCSAPGDEPCSDCRK